MRRWGLIVAAAVVCVTASSQAQAAYTVIKWKSGMCQVWDSRTPWKPWTNDYTAVSRAYKTAARAEARRAKLVAKKKCF